MISSFVRGLKFMSNCGLSTKPTMLLYSTSAASRRLEGKVALITGAASGLGKATAREFIGEGAHVIIADIDDELGARAVNELGPAAHFVSCDVTEEEQVAKAVDVAISRHGKLDIMFNNAGAAGSIFPPSIADLDMEDFDRVMRLNVKGSVLGTKHAAKVMIPAGSGTILCMSSISGVMGGLGPHAYSISKLAITGVVKSAASELCRHGVRINSISPGVIPTPLTIQQLKQVFLGKNSEEVTQIVKGTGVLKGAYCEEADVAKAALYLASDDAKYVTGHNLVVDGGLTCFKSLNLSSP